MKTLFEFLFLGFFLSLFSCREKAVVSMSTKSSPAGP